MMRLMGMMGICMEHLRMIVVIGMLEVMLVVMLVVVQLLVMLIWQPLDRAQLLMATCGATCLLCLIGAVGCVCLVLLVVVMVVLISGCKHVKMRLVLCMMMMVVAHHGWVQLVIV